MKKEKMAQAFVFGGEIVIFLVLLIVFLFSLFKILTYFHLI